MHEHVRLWVGYKSKMVEVVLSSTFFTGIETENWKGYFCLLSNVMQLVKAAMIRTKVSWPQVLDLFTTPASALSSLPFNFIQRNDNEKVLFLE